MIQPAEEIFPRIEQLQQLGYDYWDKNQPAGACRLWQQAWELIAGLMQSGRYASVEALDKTFHGRQSISSWAADYTEALRQAGLQDLSMLEESSGFCRQYLAWTSQPEALNNQNRRRLIAENTFRAGLPDQGDAIFSEYLRQNPRWGWGWASWADQYGFYSQMPWHDLNRAEQILRQALAVDNLENRGIVAERLRDILIRQGRPAAASAIESGGARRQKKERGRR